MPTGRIWKFGDDVDTDQIIPSRYMLLPEIDEMKTHAFEGLRPDFAARVRPGDVLVAGSNFGCGSSREQAPRIVKALGVSAVIARSFARIFFRNAINVGLAVVRCEGIHADAEEGEHLEYAFARGEITYAGARYPCEKYPDHILRIIENGGLIETINRLQW